jgi:hypothetical protein
MKTRFNLNERGELEDRHGRVLGRLTSVTLEEPSGGLGVKEVDSQVARQSSSERSDKKEGGAGGNQLAPDVADVWAHWCDRRQPRRTALEPSQAKLIAKALKLVDVGDLKRAIDALMASEWHRERKLLSLSTLLATRPGGPTLRDQLDQWIERGGGGTSVRSIQAQARIDEAKRDVMAAWHRDPDRPAPTQATLDARDRAIVRLAELGITVEHAANGRPIFEERP